MKQINLTEKGEIEVVFNSCYGGFGISDEALARMVELGHEEAIKASEDIKKYNCNYHSHLYNISRTDPILIQVIKELGPKASGQSASLSIGRIKLDDLINIEDRDGNEELVGCYDKTNYGRGEE